MSKVKLDVLRPWISKKITDILHIEDDVVVEFVYNQLEEEKVSIVRSLSSLSVLNLLIALNFDYSFPVPRKCKST